MAALTSGSWTVRLRNATGTAANGNARSIDMTIGKRHKFVNAIMTLTTGESPAAGVPWPGPGAFGLIRNLDAILLHNQSGWSTATVAAITASGKHVIAQSNATAGKIRFLALKSVSGTAGRAYVQVATSLTLTGGQKFYVTAIGW